MHQGEKKIDFLIIGCQRSGTTSLFEALCQHPRVWKPRKKEIHFFDNDEFFDGNHKVASGDVIKKYHHWFNFDGWHLNGEASPSYIFFPHCLERIRQYNPNIKLVICLRNPVDRCISHYKMSCDQGFENLSLLRAIEMEAPRIFLGSVQDKRRFSYVTRGFYSKQLKRVFRIFKKEQVFILKSEEIWKKNTQLNELFSFLGVSGMVGIDYPRISLNTKGEPLIVSERIKSRLLRIYRKELRLTQHLLDFNIDDWMI